MAISIQFSVWLEDSPDRIIRKIHVVKLGTRQYVLFVSDQLVAFRDDRPDLPELAHPRNFATVEHAHREARGIFESLLKMGWKDCSEYGSPFRD
jgi:hypothetical protein